MSGMPVHPHRDYSVPKMVARDGNRCRVSMIIQIGLTGQTTDWMTHLMEQALKWNPIRTYGWPSFWCSCSAQPDRNYCQKRLADAFWHTHGSMKPERNYFSEIDTQIANKLKRPIFLSDPSGALRVFNPGDSVFRSTVRVPGGRGARVPRGSGEGTQVTDELGENILIRTA